MATLLKNILPPLVEKLLPGRSKGFHASVLLVCHDNGYRALWSGVLDAAGADTVRTVSSVKEALFLMSQSDILVVAEYEYPHEVDLILSSWAKKDFGPSMILARRSPPKRLRELYRAGAFIVLPQSIGAEVIGTMCRRFIRDAETHKDMQRVFQDVRTLRRWVFGLLIAVVALTASGGSAEWLTNLF